MKSAVLMTGLLALLAANVGMTSAVEVNEVTIKVSGLS
jgi:hypothetical protein